MHCAARADFIVTSLTAWCDVRHTRIYRHADWARRCWAAEPKRGDVSLWAGSSLASGSVWVPAVAHRSINAVRPRLYLHRCAPELR
jgi:hypothetical protein